MKLLKKEVFDINKVTVVGSPTITDDGVASGFSANSYITALVDTSNVVDNVTIYSRFTYTKVGKTVWAGQGNNFTPRILISPTGNIMLYAYDGSQTGSATIVYDKINFAENEMIYAKCVISNAERIISVSSDGINWVEAKNTVALNLDLKTRLQKLYFGWISTAEYFIDGQIDLSSFKIFVDGKEVYNTLKPTYLMEKRKEGFDLSKFTVVGTLTITEYGVASGFNGSNYIRAPYRALGQNFKIFTPRFNSSDVSQQQKIVRYSDGNIRIEIYQNKIRLYRYSANNVYDLPVGRTTLQNNTDYYYYVEQTTDGTKYYLKGYISTDNKNWISDIDKTYTSAIYDYQNNAPIQISGADATQPFIGTLGLTQFSITVDNKEVFTGAKVNYYAMR